METERCPFYGIDCEYIPVAQKVSAYADEIERLREALQKIYWTTKEPEIDRIAGAALQQMHDSHAQMSDDKGQR